MFKLTPGTVLAAILTLSSYQAIGDPVVLDKSQYAEITRGLILLAEDFEDLPHGFPAPPLTIKNGLYFSDKPAITDHVEHCNYGNCLTDGDAHYTPRTFYSFPEGTLLWAVDLRHSPGCLLQVETIGNSGTLSLENYSFSTEPTTDPKFGFASFYDRSGLLSVSFWRDPRKCGTNYSFDNVTTADGTQIPPSPRVVVEPSPIEFGQVVTGGYAELSLVVTNTGDIDLSVSEIGVANPVAQPFEILDESCTDGPTPPGENCVIRVSFAPDLSGDFGDSFSLSSNSFYEPVMNIDVAGTAIALGVQELGFTPHHVTCENKTQKVKIKFDVDPFENDHWDCNAAGLPVMSGDEVTIKVKGIAK